MNGEKDVKQNANPGGIILYRIIYGMTLIIKI
jgi:hypothetical protein